MEVWALTLLLAVQEYCPASSRLVGLITKKPPEMVILESGVIAVPSFVHCAVTSVPLIHVQLRDTFFSSTATEGTVRLTPPTGSANKTQTFYLRAQQNRTENVDLQPESTLQKLELWNNREQFAVNAEDNLL